MFLFSPVGRLSFPARLLQGGRCLSPVDPPELPGELSEFHLLQQQSPKRGFSTVQGKEEAKPDTGKPRGNFHW